MLFYLIRFGVCLGVKRKFFLVIFVFWWNFFVFCQIFPLPILAIFWGLSRFLGYNCVVRMLVGLIGGDFGAETAYRVKIKFF